MKLFRAEASEGMWYNEQSPGPASWGPPASCIISLSLTVRIYTWALVSMPRQAVASKGGDRHERSGQRGAYCAILSSHSSLALEPGGDAQIAGWAHQFLAA